MKESGFEKWIDRPLLTPLVPGSNTISSLPILPKDFDTAYVPLCRDARRTLAIGIEAGIEKNKKVPGKLSSFK